MNDLPDDWYIESTGESRILDQRKVKAEIEWLQTVEARARLVIKEWRQYGGYKEPMIEQLMELEELFLEENQPPATADNDG